VWRRAVPDLRYLDGSNEAGDSIAGFFFGAILFVLGPTPYGERGLEEQVFVLARQFP
jgi:hypothetical protein